MTTKLPRKPVQLHPFIYDEAEKMKRPGESWNQFFERKVLGIKVRGRK